MATAILYGASSGALHAVTGPDHLLSLGPVALRRPPSAWRIGLAWGAGHGLGTLLLALPVLLFARFAHAHAFALWGDRLAGAALLVTALWTLLRGRARAGHESPTRAPLAVGFVHGVTGAGALVLLLPALVAGSPVRTMLFLATFALGSTLAMAILTHMLAQLGGKLAEATVARAQRLMLVSSGLVGVWWLLGG